MFVQTLPSMIQARILYFLAMEQQRFCRTDLCRLTRNVLSCNEGLDFWVERAAQHLFDIVSETKYNWFSSLSLDSEEESVGHEFDSLPSWLQEKVSSDGLLPWLPLALEDLSSTALYSESGIVEDSKDQVGEEVEDKDEVMGAFEIDQPKNVILDPEIEKKAVALKTMMLNYESSTKTIGQAREIRELCLEKGGDSLSILSVMEPWHVDDETASVLVSHISSGNEEDLTWPSHVMCSLILPKLLLLEIPASRVLLTATIEYCKLHQKATVYALLLPLILRKDGINNPISDVITRVMKESLHPAHVSAFCQNLLCGRKDERRIICLPCHRCLISDEIVWTEPLFNLFQSILNRNVCLTQDSVDHIVYQIKQSAEIFSQSLKFGNFLLCLVTKCSLLLKPHKGMLTEAVAKSNTMVTKSILSKLANL